LENPADAELPATAHSAANSGASAAAHSAASSSALRVLLVTSRLLDSASGRACTDLALGLRREGFEPVVCCYAGWGPLAAELAEAGVEIFPLRMHDGFDALFAVALSRELRARRIDVIHSFNARRAYVLSVAAGFLARTRVGVATFREAPPSGSPLLATAGRLCGEIVGALVATSEEVSEALLRARWVPPRKTQVVADGVNLTRFQASARRGPARAHWGLAERDLVVGAVIPPHRDHELPLLQAVQSELRQRVPNVRFVVSGRHGTSANWQALGPFTDSPAFYSAIDALLIPGARRFVPLTLLEALAAGVPVAAGRPADEQGLATRGPWAFASLSDAAPLALALNLEKLLRAPEEARLLVREGRNCVRDDYSIDAHVRRIASLYRAA
jgi:glycosyltransferase involved in cell wall biosynthesis